MTKSKKNNKSRPRNFLDIILITITIVLIIVIASYTIKITSGVAKSVSAPQHFVRLEIINASDEINLENKMQNYINDLTDEKIHIEIIKTKNFKLKKSEESFVISRIKDKKAATHFADLLGLDDEEVPIEELSQNVEQITVTLVLGNDSLYYNLVNESKELK